MRILKAPIWAAALLLTSAPAFAQEMYPGQAVTVNPGAAAGGRVLLYPGGQYMRVQRPLLQPGQKPSAPIKLRPPGSRPVRTASVTAVTPAPRRKAPVAAPEPAMALAPVTPPAIVEKPAEKPAPKPVQVAKVAPAPARTQPAPANAATAPSNAEMAGWNLSSHILFEPAQGEVQPAVKDAIKFLAGSLNTTISSSPSTKIEILAYGGAPGDKGSDARRLSLRRALSVRQMLIDSGVSQDRIGVRAMGGIDDTGPADRVDVFTHT